MNGRMYSVYSRRVGTQLTSRLTRAATEPRKSSTDSSGRYRRLAEFWKRSAFASGRNSQVEPSAWRYAFRPSKTSWA